MSATAEELREWFEYLGGDECLSPVADPDNRRWFMSCLDTAEAAVKSRQGWVAVLQTVAVIIAQDGETKTDGECVGEVWEYLEALGIDPEDFRPSTRTWERVRDAVGVVRDPDPTPPQGITRPVAGFQLECSDCSAPLDEYGCSTCSPIDGVCCDCCDCALLESSVARPDFAGGLLDVEDEAPSPFGSALD